MAHRIQFEDEINEQSLNEIIEHSLSKNKPVKHEKNAEIDKSSPETETLTVHNSELKHMAVQGAESKSTCEISEIDGNILSCSGNNEGNADQIKDTDITRTEGNNIIDNTQDIFIGNTEPDSNIVDTNCDDKRNNDPQNSRNSDREQEITSNDIEMHKDNQEAGNSSQEMGNNCQILGKTGQNPIYIGQDKSNKTNINNQEMTNSSQDLGKNCQVLGKIGQNPIFIGQDKGNKIKGKKRSSEHELLGTDVMVNIDNSENQYDIFGDDNNVYRKYKLRKTEQHVSYKEPPEWKPNRHYSSDEESVSLTCNECGREFESTRALYIHVRTHGAVKEYKCVLCSQKFNNNADLIAHKSTHKTESFLCTRCKLAFSDHCDFLVHNLTHMYGSHITCPECGLKYHKHYYKAHIFTHFDKKVDCPICPFVANGEFNLQAHINQHQQKHKHTCVECGKLCKSKKIYEYHMSMHTGVKKYQCLYCGKCFSTQSMRDVHTRTHTGEKPYTCEICGHKASQSGDMKRHKSTHETEKKYSCDRCGKKFIHKESLRTHMSIHTKNSLYPCPECDSTFASIGGLKTHAMFKHLTDRPVECTICDARFINNNQYQKHCRSQYHKNNVYGCQLKQENKNN